MQGNANLRLQAAGHADVAYSTGKAIGGSGAPLPTPGLPYNIVASNQSEVVPLEKPPRLGLILQVTSTAHANRCIQTVSRKRHAGHYVVVVAGSVWKE